MFTRNEMAFLSESTQESAQLAEELEFFQRNRQTAAPIIIDKDLLFIYMIKQLMMHNESNQRFVKIYDNDPTYYLSKMAEQCKFYRKAFFCLGSDESPDNGLKYLKLLAVHYSEKESDQRQLQKFYQKNLPNLFERKFLIDDVIGDLYIEELLPFFIQASEEDEGSRYKYFCGILWYCYQKGYTIKMSMHTSPDLFLSYFMTSLMQTSTIPAPIVEGDTQEEECMRVINVIFSNDYFNGKDQYTKDICYLHGGYYLLEQLKKSTFDDKIPETESFNLFFDGDHSYIKQTATNFLIQTTYAYTILEMLSLQKEPQNPAIGLNSTKETNHSQDMLLLEHQLQYIGRQKESLDQKVLNLTNLLEEQRKNGSGMQQTISMLEEKNQELAQTIQAMEQSLFEKEKTVTDEKRLSEDDIKLLQSAKIVIVGGHCHLHQTIQAMLPNVKLISPDQGKIDYNIIRNADIVCYITQYLSHATFDNVKKQACQYRIKQTYHTGNNLDYIFTVVAKKLKET